MTADPQPAARIVAALACALALATGAACERAASSAPVELCVAGGDAGASGTPAYRGRGVGGVAAALPRGARVEVRGGDGGWAAVTFAVAGAAGGSSRGAGWVRAAHLRPCANPAPPAATADGGRVDRALRLCSWRVGGPDDDGDKDWSAAARALAGCDVVVLDGAPTRTAPHRLARALGATYGNLVEDQGVAASAAAAGLAAVLFDRRRVRAESAAAPGPSVGLAGSCWSAALRAPGLDLRVVVTRPPAAAAAADGARPSDAASAVGRAYSWAAALDRPPWAVALVGALDLDDDGWRRVEAAGLRRLVGVGAGAGAGGRGASDDDARWAGDQILADAAGVAAWTGDSGVVAAAGLSVARPPARAAPILPVWADFGVEVAAPRAGQGR